MKVRKSVSFTIFLLLALSVAQFAMPSSVFASGTVGNGSAGSCTESALNTALTGGGSVTFNCGALPVTITLTSTKVISSNTQINGGGLITLDGNNAVRVFDVSTGVDFDITGLKVVNGFVTNPTPAADPLPLGGGAMLINANATVDILNSTFDDNNVVNVYGGAIYVNDGTLNITNSTFSNNSADVGAIGNFALGGGAIENNDGTVTIVSSTFHGNSVISASADGGAIYNGDFDGGETTPDGNVDTLIIRNSTFYNNLLVNDDDGSSGGAIRSNSDVTLIHNTFSENDGGVSQEFGGESGAVTFTDGNVTLHNNIFANSSGTYDCAKRDPVDGFNVAGNIIESNFNCGTPFSALDPKLGTLQNNGGPTLTIDFTDVTAATDAVSCAGGLTVDQRGVVRPTGAACDIGALEVDRFQPTVTIDKAAGQVDPTNGSVNFTVEFSESVIGFVTGDVSFTGSTVGGTLTGTVTGGPATFNVAVTGMTTPGNIVASINAGAATDTALNQNVASTSSDNVVAYDATGPTVTIDKASAQANPTTNSTINFAVVFDESVTGFDASDVTIGGTANPTTKNVTGSGSTYNVAVSGFGNDGTVTASINAGAVADSLGNLSSASSTASVTYDTTSPTVTINQAAGQNDPSNASDPTIDFTVVFSEPVSNFVSADVTVQGTAGATSGTVTEIAPNNGTTYNVSVSDMPHNGTVVATIGAGIASDAAGNSSAAATFTDNQVTFVGDLPGVTVAQAPGQLDPTSVAPANFSVVFSKPVVGFETSDVQVSGTAGGTKIGTVTEVAPMDGTTYNVAVTGMTSSGTAIVVIPAGAAQDSAGNPNALPTVIDNTVTFNFARPGVPVLTAPVSGLIVDTLQPLLDWNPSAPVAQFYQIQVATVSTFASPVIDQSNMTDTQFTPDSDLTPGLTYYWRVRGHNAIGLISTWSAVRSFKTALDTPVANAPIDDIVLPTDRPTFEWTTVPGATSYVIQISTVNSFTSITSSSNALTSPYTWHVDLPQNTPLFWRVQAKTATVVSSWSTVESFKSGNPPTVPVLVSPISNLLLTDYTPLFNWNDAALPAGVGNAFSRYEIHVDDSSSFTNPVVLEGSTTAGVITASQFTDIGAPLADNTPHYWRVRAVSTFNSIEQFSAWSATGTFRTSLATPVLTSPSNTASPALVIVRPTFNWQSVAGATGYQLTVSQSANLTSPVLNVTTGSVTAYTPTANLPANTTFFWSVRATGTNGPGLYPAVWTFKTGNPPSVPVLTAPINNLLVTDYTPLFDWINATLPAGAGNVFSRYEIQVDDSASFTDPVVIDGTTNAGLIADSQFVDNGTPLADNTPHYWRVRAVSTFNSVEQFSAWSSIGNFRTSLDTPVLQSPANAAFPALAVVRPAFSWQAVDGASGYQLVVSRSANLSSPILSVTTGNVTTYGPSVNLPPSSQFYWSVRAIGDNGPGLYPAAWTFRTGNPPSVPVLVTPSVSALVTDLTPLFDWNNSTIPTGVTFKHYEIQVDESPSFSDPLALTGTTTPALITASQYTDEGNPLNPSTTYYWRVRSVSDLSGVDQFSAWSTSRSFRTVFGEPVLLSPADAAPLTMRRTTFTWQPVSGATGYQISLSRNANMSSPILTVTTTTATYTTLTDLLPNTLFYWSVRATGVVYGPGLWSDPAWSFTTGNPPSVPALTAPAANAILSTFTPLFDWGNSTVPAGTFKHYEIQVDDNQDFQTLAFSRTTGSDPINNSKYQTQAGTDTLNPNTIYYWRVRAVSTIDLADHISGWSTVRSFRTPLAAPTSLTVISNVTIPARPTFDWDNVPGATGYIIQISISDTFGTLLVNASTTGNTASNYVPAVNLPLNTTLYWRVKAKGPNPGPWSTSSFTITP